MTYKVPVKQFTQAVLRSFMRESGLEPRLFGTRFRLRDVSAGKVDFELDIHETHLNRLQMIHGGTLASLVDLCGSLAVASMGRFATGVSTDLNVTYLRSGGVAGDKIHGTALCDKIGKSMAYTTIHVYNARGKLAARGGHTKYIADSATAGEGLYVIPDEFLDDVA